MLVCKSGNTATAGGAAKVSDLHKEGLVNVLESHRLLADSSSESVKTYRTSVIELYNCLKHSLVGAVKTELVDLELIKSKLCDLVVDLALALDLRKIADTLEQSVCDTGSAARA